jgi:hypothetical protein
MAQSQRARRELWANINHTARVCGAWVTSPPHDDCVRLEVLPDSDLPERLRAAGLDLKLIGNSERLVGNAIKYDVLVNGQVVRTEHKPGERIFVAVAMISLIDRKQSQCAYMLDRQNCCGASVSTKPDGTPSSYCQEHHHRCHYQYKPKPVEIGSSL